MLATLLIIVLALAATRVLLGVVNWIKGMLANKVGVTLTFDLRGQLVQKLHALGVGYYDRHQVGSLVSRVAHDSEVLHSLLQQITGGFLLQVFQVLAVGFMLFTLNPKLAFFTLIPAPLVVGGSLFFWRTRLSQLLPLLGLEQQAGRDPLGHALGHPRGQGVRAGDRASTTGSTRRASTCGARG